MFELVELSDARTLPASDHVISAVNTPLQKQLHDTTTVKQTNTDNECVQKAMKCAVILHFQLVTR